MAKLTFAGDTPLQEGTEAPEILRSLFLLYFRGETDIPSAYAVAF